MNYKGEVEREIRALSLSIQEINKSLTIASTREAIVVALAEIASKQDKIAFLRRNLYSEG